MFSRGTGRGTGRRGRGTGWIMEPRGSPATRGRNVNGQQVYDDDVIEAIEAEEAARAEAEAARVEAEAARVAAEAEEAARLEVKAARMKAEADEAARVAAEEAAARQAQQADLAAYMARPRMQAPPRPVFPVYVPPLLPPPKSTLFTPPPDAKYSLSLPGVPGVKFSKFARNFPEHLREQGEGGQRKKKSSRTRTRTRQRKQQRRHRRRRSTRKHGK